jgi:hypothetical protein
MTVCFTVNGVKDLGANYPDGLFLFFFSSALLHGLRPGRKKPCHSLGGWSLTSHLGGPGSISGHVMLGPNRVGVPSHLRTETDPVSETSCFLSNYFESGRWIKSENPVILCYKPSSEPYRIYLNFLFTFDNALPYELVDLNSNVCMCEWNGLHLFQ